ncbi:MAG: carbohydrate ABC transporter permease, partial [Actinomycetota bacterium]|nr:carbohydrate ABC transporter permease [Actinomycetota bacterium]
MAGRYLLLVVYAAIVFLPIYTAVVVSIQPATRLLQFPSVLIPSEIDLGVFARAYDTGRLGRYLLNSALVSTVIVAGQVPTSVLAAYAFAFL